MDALQERSALKQGVAAELGAIAFKQAYATWTEADQDLDFGQLVVAALDRLRVTKELPGPSAATDHELFSASLW